jgi:hypothetical protein
LCYAASSPERRISIGIQQAFLILAIQALMRHVPFFISVRVIHLTSLILRRQIQGGASQ